MTEQRAVTAVGMLLGAGSKQKGTSLFSPLPFSFPPGTSIHRTHWEASWQGRHVVCRAPAPVLQTQSVRGSIWTREMIA